PATRAQGSRLGTGAALRAGAGTHHAARGAGLAGVHPPLGVVRRQRARRAVPDAGRQGPRAHAGPLPRELRGCAGARAPRAAAPHPDELPRRIRAGDEGPDHRPVAGGRPPAEVGALMAVAATRVRPTASFVDPQVLARIDNLELLARTVVDGFINGLHRSPYL